MRLREMLSTSLTAVVGAIRSANMYGFWFKFRCKYTCPSLLSGYYPGVRAYNLLSIHGWACPCCLLTKPAVRRSRIRPRRSQCRLRRRRRSRRRSPPRLSTRPSWVSRRTETPTSSLPGSCSRSPLSFSCLLQSCSRSGDVVRLRSHRSSASLRMQRTRPRAMMAVLAGRNSRAERSAAPTTASSAGTRSRARRKAASAALSTTGSSPWSWQARTSTAPTRPAHSTRPSGR